MILSDDPPTDNEPCWDDYARDVPERYPTDEDVEAMFSNLTGDENGNPLHDA